MFENKINDLEAELPLGLKRLSILISSGVDFHKSIRIISKEDGHFSNYLKEVVKRIDDGSSMDNAFLSTLKLYKSQNLKRAVSQIISSYKSGENSKRIDGIANELLLKQEHKIRDYSSKSSIFGLIFIVISAVIPTMTLIMYFIGDFAFELNLSFDQISIILLLLIPIISVLIQLVSRLNSPKTLYSNTDRKYLFFSIGLLVISFIGLNFGILGLLILIFVAGYFTYKEYIKEKEIEDLEEHLPDVLMHISGMENSSFKRILYEISRSNYGKISKEFEIALNQLNSNISSKRIIQDMTKRNKSKILEKTIHLFEYALESKNLGIFSQISESTLRYLELMRIRASSMAMQKYTLLLGAVLIPIIVGITSGMVESIGEILETSKEFDQVFNSLIPNYLVLYSIIAGHHIIELENKKSSGMIFMVLMIVLSLVVYSFFGR